MREKILSVAAGLFACQGYSAVSMRHIAAAVGVTQANLYHYFKDKEDLIRSVLAFVFGGRNASLLPILDGAVPAEVRLEQSIAWFMRLLFEDTVLAKLFFRELLLDDRERLKFLTENVFQDSFSSVVRLLGEYDPSRDPMLSAIYLTSTVIGYCLFSGIVHHLDGVRPEYLDPETIAQRLMLEVREMVRRPLSQPDGARG